MVRMSLTCTHMLSVLFDAHTMCADVIERVMCNIEVSRDTAGIVKLNHGILKRCFLCLFVCDISSSREAA
jgi:hypothetical protein